MKNLKAMDIDKPKLKAAIYARVSTADQNYDQQINEVRQYAERMGWDVEVYAEKMSSMKKRPVMERLMEDARLRRVDIVLVWKLDRFGRSVRDLTDNILRLDTYGVRFICVTQGIDTDKRNPATKLMLHIMAAFAEFEREIIVERINAGKKQYLEDWAAGKVGKERHSRSGKDLAPHRPKRIFRRDLAAKLRGEGKSLRAIAKQLGIPLSTVVDSLRGK